MPPADARPSRARGVAGALARRVRGLGSRLLLVNAVVLVVPWAGLEYARWHERQLLQSLEQDLRDQAVLVRATAESTLARGGALEDGAIDAILTDAARDTRTRIRVLGASGATLADSHDQGAPEGPEPGAPSLLSSVLPSAAPRAPVPWTGETRSRYATTGTPWPAIETRPEFLAALAGRPAAYTRVRANEPQVVLFVAEPVRAHPGGASDVVAVVYVTRSTTPVMVQLHRLRSSLMKLLALSLGITVVVTLVLAWTITRPLERLAGAARRIAAGERDVAVPPVGSGEVRELADALDVMVREQRERLRYVTEFTADVAHELKSPLTSIRGAAELLREGAFDDEAARARFLSNIELDAERLDRLVSRLLELSRIDASAEPVVPVALDDVIASVVARTDSHDQPVRVSGEAGLRVRGRPHDLERALSNLVENALRFSPPAAPVRIEVARVGERVEIAVADEGPGVPEGDRARVFQRFFTTDAERAGTGLGLAIVLSVASACGGSARLAPSERGARFVLSLHPA